MATFERAAEQLKQAKVAVSDAHKLRLYALYKQATVGDCSASAPSAFRPVERAKWASWRELQGLEASEAKRRYIEVVKELLPSFKEEMTPKSQEAPAKRNERLQPRSSGQNGSLSYMHVLLQCLKWAAAAGLLLAVLRAAMPMAREFAIAQFNGDVGRWNHLVESFSPLLWFALGYAIVVLLRSQAFPWQIVSGDLMWRSAVSSLTRPSGRSHRRRRRRAPVESETDVFLRQHNIQVVSDEGKKCPRLVLKLPDDAEAFQFGDCNATIPFTLEQTADVYYRKFKEPLPDPASRLLDSITVLEERKLDEYCAVFKRRLLRFRNEAPALIKRFASSDFIEYIEDSLLDKQNRLFFVYVKNESFQSLGVLEDYSVYRSHSDKTHWTDLKQSCRVHITSSSLSFFRSRIESFISSFYCKNAPDARAYHLQRIGEEFGAPVED